jgi:hypothetical protein
LQGIELLPGRTLERYRNKLNFSGNLLNQIFPKDIFTLKFSPQNMKMDRFKRGRAVAFY